MDLIESLKKNEAIKDFVSKSLIEKVGDTRTVEKICHTIGQCLNANCSAHRPLT